MTKSLHLFEDDGHRLPGHWIASNLLTQISRMTFRRATQSFSSALTTDRFHVTLTPRSVVDNAAPLGLMYDEHTLKPFSTG